MSGYDYQGYGGYAAPPAAGQEYQPPPAAYGAPYGTPAAYATTPYGQAAYGAPPAYGAPAPAAGSEEIRTIFITGFPADVKDRELNNMMRFIPGYEAAQMTWKNGQAQGFALFSSGGAARAACDLVTQHLFDVDHPLRCEMARKNMYIKADTLDPNVKRPRTGPGGYTGTSTFAAPAVVSYRAAVPAYAGGAASGGGGGGGGGANLTGDNPPCNTLFVGNLSETVNEAELNSIFATQPGFRQLKVVRGRTTTAFVEYDTVENAVKVHNTQQGVVLASNDRGGIRIQFSRNPFGKKRDITGVLIDTPVRNPDFAAPGAVAGVPGAPGV